MNRAPIFSWRTTTSPKGFTAVVVKIQPTIEMQNDGRFAITTTLRSVEGFKTRARAKSFAQKCCRFYKAQAA